MIRSDLSGTGRVAYEGTEYRAWSCKLFRKLSRAVLFIVYIYIYKILYSTVLYVYETK